MKKYERYQDYVIKDGQLVGSFNEMYRDYEDPLEQTYGTGQQKYGLDYFTNLDEIMKYWSDSVDILNWGQVNDLASGEGYRTFFYGKIK